MSRKGCRLQGAGCKSLLPRIVATCHLPLATLFLFALLLVSCQTPDDSWQIVEERGALYVGLDPTYPPFEFDDGAGSVQGIDVDLARALADELGVEVQFVLFGYDGLYDALGTGQVDVLISGMVIVPERERDFSYSEPYFNAGELLVVSADESEIASMRDLNGRSLAVELGAQGHVEATIWQRNLGDLTILPQETGNAALTAVLENQADAALTDAITARLFLGDGVDLTAVSPPITVDPFAIVVREQNGQLLNQINQALNQIESSGQLEQILEKWFEQ